MRAKSAICVLAFAVGGAQAASALGDTLSGTSWQLVKIMSMDDSVDLPDDRSKYTLEFRADGSASILADCNRAMGSWASESDSQVRFGQIASTRALCPPDSLSEIYLAQFDWVRSYVMRDGHLFLATMADGSIIELEPTAVAPLAATVLEEEVRTADLAVMQSVILMRLFDQYASEHDIRAEAVEIDNLIAAIERGISERGLTSEKDLTKVDAAEAARMRHDFAETTIRQWKINKALYAEFGGRIIYQQLGPEPLDAYRMFLERREAEGAFAIHDPTLAEGFWRYFTNEAIHDFMQPGSADEARAFTVPPWHQNQ